jgi:hypothetical protein
MKLSLFVTWVLLAALCASAAPYSPILVVECEPISERGHHHVVVRIKNISGRELTIQHPARPRALTFVVLNDDGNLMTPEGVAKVTPRQKTILLKPGETFEYQNSQLIELAHSKGLAFPFLTGTGLFAYDLEKGQQYWLTAIYRPQWRESGIASAEQLMTF